MEKHWEQMSDSEKLDWLRSNIEHLRATLKQYDAERDAADRRQNDRIVNLEQELEKMQNLQSAA